MSSIPGRLGRYNVANRLYKASLLNTVCLVAGVSIFFFGYDQGLMGGVNTARDYAELMGFGHWDEDEQIVVVDKPLLQGGIVSSQPYCHIAMSHSAPGCRVLPPRNTCRLPHWWLVWRSLRKAQNYRSRLHLVHSYSRAAVSCSECELDVLW